jgi:hypothetical protein
MNSYVFTCTLTFETVIKAETQEQADAEFLKRDNQQDVVYDSGISVQVIEDAPMSMPSFTIGGKNV